MFAFLPLQNKDSQSPKWRWLVVMIRCRLLLRRLQLILIARLESFLASFVTVPAYLLFALWRLVLLATDLARHNKYPIRMARKQIRSIQSLLVVVDALTC